MSLKQQLLSRSAIIFTVRIAGAGLVFLLQAIIARTWGSALLGEYFVAIAMANLLAITLPLGFHTVGSYFAADYAAKGQGLSLRRFVLRAYSHIVVPGIAILVLAGLFVDRFGDAGLRLSQMWWPISLLAVGTAIIYVNGAVLIGLKRPYAGFFADAIFRPLIILAAFIITSYLVISVPMAAILCLPFWTTPSLLALGLMAIQGVGGMVSQLAVARAFRLADASLLVPLEFVRLPMAVALGYFLFAEQVEWAVLLGGAIILAAIILLFTKGRQKSMPSSTP